jgi:hypothetical protein
VVHMVAEYKYKLARGTKDKPRGVTEAVVVIPWASICYIGSSPPLASGVSSFLGPPVVLQLGSSQIHWYWDIAHEQGSIQQIVLLLGIGWTATSVVVWPLVSEGYKRNVLSWGSFCCQLSLGHSTVGGPFFDGIVPTDSGCPHDVSQYGVTEPFFKELDAFRTFQCVSHLPCQFLKFGYICIYIVVFKLEFSYLCSGSVLRFHSDRPSLLRI